MSSSPLAYLFSEELYTIPPVLTVVINTPWENVNEDHRTLLAKILGAVKVGLASARVVHKLAVNMDDLAEMNSPRILIFGTQAPINPYEHIQAQGFSVIRADEFAALDDAKKKSLWLALKNMFAA